MKDIFSQFNESERPLQDDEMMKDGLIYCAKCNTPRQCRVNDPETGELLFTPKIKCDCQLEEEERIQAEREETDRLFRIEANRQRAFKDDKFRKCTFDSADKTDAMLFHVCEKYCDEFDHMKSNGNGLVLHGDCGTGKTYAACCVANRLIDEEYTVLMVNLIDLVNELQSTYDKEPIYDRIRRCDLLVIDDLATERDTAFMQESVFNIIDTRYRAGKPMIITTNMTLAELDGATDLKRKRYHQRIMEKCLPVKVDHNKRTEKMFETIMDMRKRMGIDE